MNYTKLAKNIMEINKKENGKQRVEDFLHDLNLDEIMSVQTIMYLGRDEDYNSNQNKNDIFLNLKKELELQGVSTKEIEISQLLGKKSWYEDFLMGCQILGI